MQVRLVELMQAGIRRPREACLTDPGTTGTLIVFDDAWSGAAGRSRGRVAQLWELWGLPARRQPLAPLFDVQILRITRRGLLLRGFQISSERRQYVQEWWAVPIGEPEER